MVSSLGALVALKYGLHDGMLRLFSVQQIIDCMKHLKGKQIADKYGCFTSTSTEVFEFMKKGLVEESVYPFKAKRGLCRDSKCDEDLSTEKGKNKRMLETPDIPEEAKRAKVYGEIEKVKVTDFERMKLAIEKGPVAITVPLSRAFCDFTRSKLNDDDVQNVFPLMKAKKKTAKGKRSEASMEAVSQQAGMGAMQHALMVIGYGTDPKTKRKFYLVVNTWPSWGFNSYGKIAVDYFNKESDECLYDYYFGQDNVTFS